MKTVIDMCPFVGLRWEDEDGKFHSGGTGLTFRESERLDRYFSKFYGQGFSREKSIELAQMALDDKPIPEGWKPQDICPHNGPKMTHSNSEVECLSCHEIIGKGRK